MDLHSVDREKISNQIYKQHRKLESDNARKKYKLRKIEQGAQREEEGQGQENQGKPEKVEKKTQNNLTP